MSLFWLKIKHKLSVNIFHVLFKKNEVKELVHFSITMINSTEKSNLIRKISLKLTVKGLACHGREVFRAGSSG